MTLEYRRIETSLPQVQTILPKDFQALYMKGELPQFDAVVTFSSIEHSGLGRYGDALNPWGDIIAIARAWCTTKKGGSLAIGVPFHATRDTIQFNAHRVYGPARYPFLTTNWKQVDHFFPGEYHQSVFHFK